MRFIIIGGGGKVALKFSAAATAAKHSVVSVVRRDRSFPEIRETGAEPRILSVEDAKVSDFVKLFEEIKPDAVIWSAGAGGKGGVERTKAVDYEGAIKVFDALEASNFHRFIMVSAADLRDISKPPPSYYSDASKALSERMWKAIPDYMKYKRLADIDLHKRKSLKFTIVRPGGLTDEAAHGVEIGKPQLGSVSRESVAQVILAAAENPGAGDGRVWDIMNGDDEPKEAVAKAIKEGVNSWHD